MNQIIPANGRRRAPIGFIVTGMAGPYLNHVLNDIGLLGQFPILQMGMSYPVDVELVAEFAGHVQADDRDRGAAELPGEEHPRRPVQAAAARAAVDLSSRLYGKTFPVLNGKKIDGIPATRGLNPSVLAQILIPLIKATEEIPPELRNGRLSAELARLKELSRPKLAVFNEKVVARTPTFCPGCPHRDSSAMLLELRSEPGRPRVHEAALRHRPGRPGRPRRYRLLHDAHVRPDRTAHAQLQRHGPRRRDRVGHRPVHHQQADRVHGRRHLLPLRPGRHQQQRQGRARTSPTSSWRTRPRP